jgi:hypothetical protein
VEPLLKQLEAKTKELKSEEEDYKLNLKQVQI